MFAVHNLPPRPHLDHLRKQAKQRLAALKVVSGDASLADAQLVVARQYGFSSWRALKAEIDRRNGEHPPPLFALARPRVAAPSGVIARLQSPLDMEGMLFPCMVAAAAGPQLFWALAAFLLAV